MDPLLVAFIVLAVALGAFAYAGMPSGTPTRRLIVVMGLAVVIAGAFLGASDLLGRPKPTRIEVLRSFENVKVLAHYLRENESIALWLELPGTPEPRYYVLPWDTQMASQLTEATERNEAEHGVGVGMSMLPFERGISQEGPMFFPMPQPKRPDKTSELPPGTVFKMESPH